MDRHAQTVGAASQQPARALHASGRPRELKGWRTVRELAEELRFTVSAPADPEDACRLWLRKNGIASVKRGRVILVSSIDVENALRKLSA